MAESNESNKNVFGGITELLNDFKNEFFNFFNQVKYNINEALGFELFEVTKSTTQKLKGLQDDILKISDDDLSDKKINENEKKILDELLKDEKIINFFNWLKDSSIDDDLFNSEKEVLLKIIKEQSDNNKDSLGDLTEEEMNKIASTFEYKYNLLNSVLEDDKIKDKNPKPTKKDILNTYNNFIKENKNPTKDEIINKLISTTQ